MAYINQMLRPLGLNLQRWHEPLDNLSSLLGKDKVTTIIDGGAYKGNKAAILLDTFPDAEVYCFEPQSEPFAFLKQRFAAAPRCIPVKQALSDYAGTAELFVTDERYTSSLMQPLASDITTSAMAQVNVTTLDLFMQENHLKNIDVIKLDLQGNELPALKGGKAALAGCKAILAEVNFRERYAGCTGFAELYGFLREAGFALYKIYEIHGYPNGAWKLGDALFMKEELLPTE
ncbi:MAG: FkbM family methyltransferase [Pseudomonadota bacterium]